MTGMTVRARTAGREAWSAPTSGCRNRYPRFWTPRPISRTGCLSLPLTRLTVPAEAQRAFPGEQPGAASAPWCSPPSSRAEQHRTRRTAITAFWPLSRTFSRSHASPMPARPESTVLDPTSSTRDHDQPGAPGWRWRDGTDYAAAMHRSAPVCTGLHWSARRTSTTDL